MESNKIVNNQESFEELAQSLKTMNEAFQQSAASAINKHVTCRNWLNGFYIVHYEQNGSDRAKYGEKLLQKLSERLNMKGYSYRDLRLYRQFFIEYRQLYSEICQYVNHISAMSQSLIGQLEPGTIRQSLIAKLQSTDNQTDIIWQSPIAKSDEQSINIPAERLFNRLSYTHFVQLLPIEDPLERAFYEIECMKGVWSTRELKRQIDSGYFTRSGLSRDKESRCRSAKSDGYRQVTIRV